MVDVILFGKGRGSIKYPDLKAAWEVAGNDNHDSLLFENSNGGMLIKYDGVCYGGLPGGRSYGYDLCGGLEMTVSEEDVAPTKGRCDPDQDPSTVHLENLLRDTGKDIALAITSKGLIVVERYSRSSRLLAKIASEHLGKAKLF